MIEVKSATFLGVRAGERFIIDYCKRKVATGILKRNGWNVEEIGTF